MGSRETTETEQMQNAIRKVEDTRNNLKDIYKKLNKQLKTSTAAHDENKVVADAFRNYSAKLSTNGENPTLAGIFGKLADLELFVTEAEERKDFLIGLKISETMKEFVKGEVREARYEKKKFDKVRLDHESAQEQLRSAQKTGKTEKIKPAEAEVEKCKQAADRGQFDTLNKLNDVETINKFSSLEKACDFIEAYNDYFEKGHQYVSQLMPIVQKYRASVQKAREDFTNTQRKRKENFDDKGKAKAKVFGLPLDEVVKKDNAPVPVVVSKCIDWISKNALEQEGIFRVSGGKIEVDQLKQQFEDNAQAVAFKKEIDPHIVTGVLKQFFRELPVPLLTFDLYDEFMAVFETDNPQEQAKRIKPLVAKLPKANQDTLRTLIALAKEVVQREEKNRMSAYNMGTVLGPNLIYRKVADPMRLKMDLERGNELIESMIEYYSFIFEKKDESKPAADMKVRRLTVKSFVNTDDNPMLTTWSITSPTALQQGIHSDPPSARASMTEPPEPEDLTNEQ